MNHSPFNTLQVFNPTSGEEGVSIQSLKLDGTETFDLVGIEGGVRPRQDVQLAIHRSNGETEEIPLTVRVETPIEADYYNHGGILPFVLRHLIEQAHGLANG